MNDHREIPIRSSYTCSNNPYVQNSLVPTSLEAKNHQNPMDTVRGAIKQAETMADNFWNHVRISPNVAGTAMGRIVQGTKVLAHGGTEKLFQQIFGIFPVEKLLNSYTCYISTSSGPVIGTLYVSTIRLAFCSDHPLSHNTLAMQKSGNHYKVVVPVDQVSMVTPSTNRLNPKEKYIEVVTVDGYEFIFMGLLAYENALKTIKEALPKYPKYYRGNLSVQVLL
ncbi:hypothetical protein Lal_00029388 [Lupinus albus]|uniref:Putative GRAM domain, PH domain-containing protein n=1 Tax=Lupinus albus TaxID=3870 RepID=A0A6A4NU10_LUPAL|nr:putative GRAM domain, PH domain-containing protein [Lupinus albus]KAF1885499.1 hypothetical protein Lal_00029388 [Lupinus albus]